MERLMVMITQLMVYLLKTLPLRKKKQIQVLIGGKREKRGKIRKEVRFVGKKRQKSMISILHPLSLQDLLKVKK